MLNLHRAMNKKIIAALAIIVTAIVYFLIKGQQPAITTSPAMNESENYPVQGGAKQISCQAEEDCAGFLPYLDLGECPSGGLSCVEGTCLFICREAVELK